jgi:hypothetical protein
MVGIVVTGAALVPVYGADDAVIMLVDVPDDRYVMPVTVVVPRSMTLRCQNCESFRAVEFDVLEKKTPASNVM